jgi:N4-(beta-N-acetylglucosaminyl)-L-asparaginase
MPEPIVIATWPFGRIAAETAIKQLSAGKPALDSVIAGAQDVENDLSVHSVGFGSLPDRVGQLTLDSCVMDGKTLACGGVAALQHIRSAAAVARQVMETTPHVLLVGEGAKWFALQNGFKLEMPLTVDALQEWYEKHPDAKMRPKNTPKQPEGGEDNHDTVTVLGLDKTGNLGGVCTTSGLSHKLPGRVGDSPIIGAGLYVDNEAGAAGATGVGEEVIRICGSFTVVEAMRAGKTPQQACEMACQRVIAVAHRRGVHPARVAFLALNPKGEFGAACTEGTDFRFAVGRGAKVELLTAKEVQPTM